jgi:hypothetical protein
MILHCRSAVYAGLARGGGGPGGEDGMTHQREGATVAGLWALDLPARVLRLDLTGGRFIMPFRTVAGPDPFPRNWRAFGK